MTDNRTSGFYGICDDCKEYAYGFYVTVVDFQCIDCAFAELEAEKEREIRALQLEDEMLPQPQDFK